MSNLMQRQAHLRQVWDQAGYGTQMGSSCVVPPPEAEFRRVYHLTSAEYGISNLALQRLKVARFSESNDPFELMAANCSDASLRRALHSHKEIYNSHKGLLCFSGNWTDPVLWSHYGARHGGICLGFDIKRRLLKEVSYEVDRIDFDAHRKISQIDAMVEEVLVHTKFSNWRYEAEHRLLVELDECLKEGSLHFLPFGQDLVLREVIFGAVCDLSLASVRALVERMYGSDVKVYKSRPAFGGFTIVPKESTVDW